jgi:hypothetical protein
MPERVKADREEADGRPCSLGAAFDKALVEGGRLRLPEHEPASVGRAKQVRGERCPQGGDDRHSARTSAALGVDEALARVPGTAHVDAARL